MRVLLLTGPGGDAQGWGDMDVTKAVSEAARAAGCDAHIAWVETEADFRRTLDGGAFDIVWSALYHITPNDRFIGTNEGGTWVADEFDARGIPYVGSNSQTMKDMIDKYRTHETLANRGVAVPGHHLVRVTDGDLSAVRYPAFVKPMGESRSVGVTDDSVVFSEAELRRQVAYVEREFHQPALVEDFLPGDEFTVLVIGNGVDQVCLPGLVTVGDKERYGRHKVLRADMRGVGLTKIVPPGPRGNDASALARSRAHRREDGRRRRPADHGGQRHPRTEAAQELGSAALHAAPPLAGRGARGLPPPGAGCDRRGLPTLRPAHAVSDGTRRCELEAAGTRES